MAEQTTHVVGPSQTFTELPAGEARTQGRGRGAVHREQSLAECRLCKAIMIMRPNCRELKQMEWKFQKLT